jgi:hypothetical protein
VSQFGDLRQFLDRDLTLQVGDKEYTIPAPNAETGLNLRARVVMGEMQDFDEVIAGVELCGGKWDTDKNEWVKPKGSIFARLMREQDWDSVYRIIKTALIFYSVSRERANIYWRTGGLFEDGELEGSPQTPSSN